MKTLNLKSFLMAFAVLAGVALFSTSCDTDACEDTVCQNGGVETELLGQCFCDCPERYTGTNCETDLCAGLTCLNGADYVINNGVCVCDCPEGYEGTDCGTEERAKFIGTFLVADQCSNSGSAAFNITIAASSTNVTTVLISNFWDAFSNNVVATVDGNTLTIASQEPDNDGFIVSGTGTINTSVSPAVVTVTYTVDDGTNTDTCNSTWTLQ